MGLQVLDPQAQVDLEPAAAPQPAAEALWTAQARAHDLQAASVYLGMVACGSVLYAAISLASPGSRLPALDHCQSLITLSWLGPLAHIGVLRLLPESVYCRHRTAVTLGMRAYYLLATAAWSAHTGFGLCGVGKPGAGPESPLSALLWRSGVIGLVWYSLAFPLPVRLHMPCQAVFWAAYAASLGPLVCSSLDRVLHGQAGLAGMLAAGHGLWAQLLAAVGAPAAAQQSLLAAAAAWRTRAGLGGGACMVGVSFLQLLLGFALPTFVLACAEANSRLGWERQVQAAQQAAAQQRGSPSSSAANLAAVPAGPSGSNGHRRQSSSGGEPVLAGSSLRAIAAPSAEALAAAAALPASARAAAAAEAAAVALERACWQHASLGSLGQAGAPGDWHVPAEGRRLPTRREALALWVCLGCGFAGLQRLAAGRAAACLP